MKSNSRLYGEGVEVPIVPKEIAEQRIVLLKRNLNKVLDTDYRNRDYLLLSEISKAIDFWSNISSNKTL